MLDLVILMAMKVHIPFTYEDYKSLPESETKRYELLGGELVMVPAPLTYHQRVSRNLEGFLWDFVKDNELGEVYSAPIDVVLGRPGKEDVVQPDILFVAKDRLSIIAEEEIRGAPDLVVEIFSPSTAERDRTYKKRLYGRNGVKELWLVDPDLKTVEVFQWTRRGFQSKAVYGHKDQLVSPLLPGLTIPLREVF
ncbi:Uma2 family endonuclease [Candidatus Acetothermia bacterium]|nr:Uma2 family endonuclease [Candidatus Acetothermia bacterium]